MASTASTPTIATTIMSSTRVKPVLPLRFNLGIECLRHERKAVRVPRLSHGTNTRHLAYFRFGPTETKGEGDQFGQQPAVCRKIVHGHLDGAGPETPPAPAPVERGCL